LKRILKLSKNANSLHLKKKKRIVYIGRLTTQKNLDFIIKSLSNIKLNNLELFIIGSGPQKKYLKSLVINLGLKNKIYFLKSSKENYSILKTADLFVMASLWEGMPITICEAMLLEVPVVCTDFLAGPRFYLGKKSQRGWIVPKNDMFSFTKTIEYVLSNSKKIKHRKNKAKLFILKNMEIDKNINDYEDIFFNFKLH
jgi:glycosyltransferase involved in cell wall biosynthesis